MLPLNPYPARPMTDSTRKPVSFYAAQDDMRQLSTSDLVQFCMMPGRRWDDRAREIVAETIGARTDLPDDVARAFQIEGNPERLSELAILFAAKLGSKAPLSLLDQVSFDDAYRPPPIKEAFFRLLSSLHYSAVRDLLIVNPRERIALFRFAYDDELFRGLLRDKDWKGFVGSAGRPALGAICDSLVNDGHTAQRRRHAIDSVLAILAESKEPLDVEERAAFEETTAAWRALLEETSTVLEVSPNAVDVLLRLEPHRATEWADPWVEAGRADLSAQLALFTFLSPPLQWRAIEGVAGKKRRAVESGRLRREILRLPEPFRHIAGMARERQASPAVMKLLSGEVFSHRRHRARFDELMGDATES